MIECLQNRVDNVDRAVGVFWLVVIIQNHINLEQREFRLGCSECFDLVRSIVGVGHVVGVFYDARDGQERYDTVDKAVHWFLGQFQ